MATTSTSSRLIVATTYFIAGRLIVGPMCMSEICAILKPCSAGGRSFSGTSTVLTRGGLRALYRPISVTSERQRHHADRAQVEPVAGHPAAAPTSAGQPQHQLDRVAQQRQHEQRREQPHRGQAGPGQQVAAPHLLRRALALAAAQRPAAPAPADSGQQHAEHPRRRRAGRRRRRPATGATPRRRAPRPKATHNPFINPSTAPAAPDANRPTSGRRFRSQARVPDGNESLPGQVDRGQVVVGVAVDALVVGVDADPCRAAVRPTTRDGHRRPVAPARSCSSSTLEASKPFVARAWPENTPISTGSSIGASVSLPAPSA